MLKPLPQPTPAQIGANMAGESGVSGLPFFPSSDKSSSAHPTAIIVQAQQHRCTCCKSDGFESDLNQKLDHIYPSILQN
jgi:hypothetical protein